MTWIDLHRSMLGKIPYLYEGRALVRGHFGDIAELAGQWPSIDRVRWGALIACEDNVSGGSCFLRGIKEGILLLFMFHTISPVKRVGKRKKIVGGQSKPFCRWYSLRNIVRASAASGEMLMGEEPCIFMAILVAWKLPRSIFYKVSLQCFGYVSRCLHL